jgi:hypothetical protein
MLYKTWKYGGVEKIYDTKYKYGTHTEKPGEYDKAVSINDCNNECNG